MLLFTHFKIAKLPFCGRLLPSAHILSKPAIASGLDQVEKSAFGIAALLAGASMISGRMVETVAEDGMFSFVARLRANEWTAVLARP